MVKPAEGAARCSKLASHTWRNVVRDTSLTILTCLLTNSLTTYSLTHSLTYSLTHFATRRGHSPTSTSHGRRFDGELNRLAAETGCKGAEDGGNAPASGEIVQVRLLPFPASNPPTRETSNQPT